ncbi:retrovirus-related Pol polyprotein from transposon 412 [Trichonephila clavipes]|nr:retrovirus-related Pol polyprotein from transposon 412 [Trichonephila clavipes]
MDYFTKWPEVYPIPDQEAPTVAEAVVQHWISRYGVPLQLHSDQGRNFVSAVLKGVCELLGIDKTKTTPLHPQSDGMVERFNRTILNNLTDGLQEPTRLGPESSSLSASVPQRRSRDYRIFTIPDAFWPRSSSPL